MLERYIFNFHDLYMLVVLVVGKFRYNLLIKTWIAAIWINFSQLTCNWRLTTSERFLQVGKKSCTVGQTRRKTSNLTYSWQVIVTSDNLLNDGSNPQNTLSAAEKIIIQGPQLTMVTIGTVRKPPKLTASVRDNSLKTIDSESSLFIFIPGPQNMWVIPNP